MNNNDLTISINDLTNIAKELEEKRKKIKELYTSQIKPTLIQATPSLTEAKVPIEENKKELELLFTNFDKKMTSIIETLTTKIIPSYNDTKSSIVNIFESSFKSELQDALDMMKD